MSYDDDKWNELFELAKPYLTVRHNQVHTEICYSFAQQLLEKLGGDPEIVLPAIILHDVGWSAVPTEQHLLAFGPRKIDENIRRIHEVEGAKIAARLLEQTSVKEENRLEICRIIESHDSSEKAISLEEKIVKDADKLFRFSPEGFSIDAERFAIERVEYREMLQQFIKHWFFTDLAKEIAAKELPKIKNPQL